MARHLSFFSVSRESLRFKGGATFDKCRWGTLHIWLYFYLSHKNCQGGRFLLQRQDVNPFPQAFLRHEPLLRGNRHACILAEELRCCHHKAFLFVCVQTVLVYGVCLKFSRSWSQVRSCSGGVREEWIEK